MIHWNDDHTVCRLSEVKSVNIDISIIPAQETITKVPDESYPEYFERLMSAQDKHMVFCTLQAFDTDAPLQAKTGMQLQFHSPPFDLSDIDRLNELLASSASMASDSINSLLHAQDPKISVMTTSDN